MRAFLWCCSFSYWNGWSRGIGWIYIWFDCESIFVLCLWVEKNSKAPISHNQWNLRDYKLDFRLQRYFLEPEKIFDIYRGRLLLKNWWKLMRFEMGGVFGHYKLQLGGVSLCALGCPCGLFDEIQDVCEEKWYTIRYLRCPWGVAG